MSKIPVGFLFAVAVIAGAGIGFYVRSPAVPGYLLEMGASVCEANYGLREAQPGRIGSKYVTFSCKNGATFHDILVDIRPPPPPIPTRDVVGKGG